MFIINYLFQVSCFRWYIAVPQRCIFKVTDDDIMSIMSLMLSVCIFTIIPSAEGSPFEHLFKGQQREMVVFLSYPGCQTKIAISLSVLGEYAKIFQLIADEFRQVNILFQPVEMELCKRRSGLLIDCSSRSNVFHSPQLQNL